MKVTKLDMRVPVWYNVFMENKSITIQTTPCKYCGGAISFNPTVRAEVTRRVAAIGMEQAGFKKEKPSYHYECSRLVKKVPAWEEGHRRHEARRVPGEDAYYV